MLSRAHYLASCAVARATCQVMADALTVTVGFPLLCLANGIIQELKVKFLVSKIHFPV